jgi:hypothetical protein
VTNLKKKINKDNNTDILSVGMIEFMMTEAKFVIKWKRG